MAVQIMAAKDPALEACFPLRDRPDLIKLFRRDIPDKLLTREEEEALWSLLPPPTPTSERRGSTRAPVTHFSRTMKPSDADLIRMGIPYEKIALFFPNGHASTVEEAIILANIKWAFDLANRGVNAYGDMTLEDLLCCAFAGTLHALQKFDRTKGFRFNTYMKRWVDQAMQRGSIGNRAIQIPINVVPSLLILNRYALAFEQRMKRPPTREEVEAYVFQQKKMSAGNDVIIAFYSPANMIVGSIDEPVDPGDPDGQLKVDWFMEGWQTSAENDYLHQEAREQDAALVEMFLARLPDQERRLVTAWAYGDDQQYIRNFLLARSWTRDDFEQYVRTLLAGLA